MRLHLSVILLIALLLPLAARAAAGEADIYRLIQDGRLEEARQELSRVQTASRRDGTHLFFQALLEPNGPRAAELMEVALNSSVDVEYREPIYLRLAQYYYLTNAWEKLEKLIVNYRVKFERGKFRNEMMRYSILVDEHSGAYESALRQTDRFLLENNSGEAQQWGEIDKARVLLGHDKGIGAEKTLRGLSREKSGPGVPQALYLLTIDAVRNRRADDAVFYYNILREGYPAAVGQDALVDRLAVMAGRMENQSAEAERLTGTFYSVQVGVFSDESNAKKLAKSFKEAGYKVDVGSKSVSSVRYHVVYVGRYPSYAEATAIKTHLEAAQNEVYQVVAR